MTAKPITADEFEHLRQSTIQQKLTDATEWAKSQTGSIDATLRQAALRGQGHIDVTVRATSLDDHTSPIDRARALQSIYRERGFRVDVSAHRTFTMGSYPAASVRIVGRTGL